MSKKSKGLSSKIKGENTTLGQNGGNMAEVVFPCEKYHSGAKFPCGKTTRAIFPWKKTTTTAYV